MRIFQNLLTPRQIKCFLSLPGGHTTPGRQGTGYLVTTLEDSPAFLPLWALFPQHTPLERDLFRIQYPQGASIPVHTDPVQEGREHHRLNIILQGAPEGGVLWVEGQPVPLSIGDGYLFRPDLIPHEVTVVQNGPPRIVLSLGSLLASSKEVIPFGKV